MDCILLPRYTYTSSKKTDEFCAFLEWLVDNNYWLKYEYHDGLHTIVCGVSSVEYEQRKKK